LVVQEFEDLHLAHATPHCARQSPLPKKKKMRKYENLELFMPFLLLQT